MTFIVASLPVRKLSDLEKIKDLTDADYVELRLDYMNRLPDIQSFVELIKNYKDKIIVTIRERDEGGVNSIDPKVKSEFLKKLSELNYLYDVEAKFALKYNIPYEGKIVSVHYFDRVPPYEEVKEILSKFTNCIRKVAVIAKPGYKQLLARLLEDFHDISVMPMGSNPLERIAFSLLGSNLVYGHVGEETAKGQMHYKDLKKILNYVSIITSSPTTLTG
ncbi:MAG: type I 3-dehydroquinate dehydratase [Sulfolobus sp.]